MASKYAKAGDPLIEAFYQTKGNPCSRLLKKIRACDHCTKDLPLGPRPVLNFHPDSRVLIVGQAPGTKVHATGLPWNDPSGERLRQWMGVTKEEFYDVRKFAIVPMGYCYPGKGKGGDLPPRQECAELWLDKILDSMNNVELIICIGQYAQAYYIDEPKKNLTETVKAWKEYLCPQDDEKLPILPLPHPSPRNLMWLKKNPWFEKQVIKQLKLLIKKFNKH